MQEYAEPSLSDHLQSYHYFQKKHGKISWSQQFLVTTAGIANELKVSSPLPSTYSCVQSTKSARQNNQYLKQFVNHICIDHARNSAQRHTHIEKKDFEKREHIQKTVGTACRWTCELEEGEKNTFDLSIDRYPPPIPLGNLSLCLCHRIDRVLFMDHI